MVMRPSRGSREQQRAAFLAEAGALIGSSLDHERVLPRLARLAVHALGDLCAIDLLQADGTISRVASAHVDLSERGGGRHSVPATHPRGSSDRGGPDGGGRER